MAKTSVVTLDLNFQGSPNSIAAYLIKHSTGAVLIECGPGSTVGELQNLLKTHGLIPSDVTHVLLTHIHLDHAGAAGWFASQGSQIVVHPKGAPHLINPEKLLASARRIYGAQMDTLWGEFLPVPQSKLVVPADEEEIAINGLRFLPLDTPGHAEHHYAYMFEGICFSGDVGGVRLRPDHYLRVPMPPPELHFGKWRESVARLQRQKPQRIAPTHFGIYDDTRWHLEAMERGLVDAERWLEEAMKAAPTVDELRQRFLEWMDRQGREQNFSSEMMRAYELANPPGMSADGMMRYWNKVRMAA
jgi:glyoxylase-like metal-dependent hydrolase (beta-lactamase superfamily II)